MILKGLNMQKYKNRSEVPEKYKWSLVEFFKDEDDFNENYKVCEKQIEDLLNYRGCTKDSDKLYEYLDKEINASAIWEDLYVYSYLINDQELGISKNVERLNKAQNLGMKLESNTSFFSPELLKLEKNEYEKLFNDNPKLVEFKAYLDDIYREKEHILTDNEEKIVSELVNSMNNFSNMSSTLLNNEHDYGKITLDNGEEEIIATNNYGRLLQNEDKKIRKTVYESLNSVLDRYGATSAELLNSYVNMNNTLSKIRHFNSAWDKNLFSKKLSNKVFDSLVNAVESNLSSIHKYFKLKKNVLGLDELNMYDLNLKMSGSNKEYSIEDATNLIYEALKPLGDDYLEKYKKVIDNRFIDYCQYKGKCSGGYNFSTMRQDARILLSFNGNLESVSTIAHEAGHNVNHQYMKEVNPLQYRETSNIVAEVASLTNECLLSNYIVENETDKSEKLSGLENIIDVIVSNLFGAVREGKMEQDMYNHVLDGNSLTKDYMDELTRKSIEKYYGDAVKLDKYTKNSWIRRSHYYMNFYLYSYAICISVAINVAEKILNNEEGFLDKYKEFLKTGGDIDPIDAYKILDIDLEDENVYINAIKYFASLIDKYNTIKGSD